MLKNVHEIVAFIPAAGLGKRLKPLTDNKPKALVTFLGKTMLEQVIIRLDSLGIKNFIVNIHHFPGQMRECIKKLQCKYSIRISDESDLLLDTGGGLCNAAKLMMSNEKSLLVHNVDVYANIDLELMLQFHKEQNADVTLAVSDRNSSRKLLFNNHILCGWKNLKTGEEILNDKQKEPRTLSFSGIHIIDKSIFAHCPNKTIFPVMPWYIDLSVKKRICGWEHSPNNWADLGTLERIREAEEKAGKNKQL